MSCFFLFFFYDWMQLKELACLQWNLGTSPGRGGESTGNQLSVDWQPKGLCLGCLLLYNIITCIGCSVNATCKLLFCCSVLQMWLLHVCQSWGRGNSPLWLFLRFLSSFLPLLKMFGFFFSTWHVFPHPSRGSKDRGQRMLLTVQRQCGCDFGIYK